MGSPSCGHVRGLMPANALRAVAEYLGVEGRPERPLEARRRAQAADRAKTEAALVYELRVLESVVGARVTDRELAGNLRYRMLRPELRPMPDGAWERERAAARRIAHARLGGALLAVSDPDDLGAGLEPPKGNVRPIAKARKAREAKEPASVAEDATHHDIATDWLARARCSPAPIAYSGGACGAYDAEAGLWKAIPPETLRAEIGRRYLAKTCKRYGDYRRHRRVRVGRGGRPRVLRAGPQSGA